jgi:SAM-dependent methyltransferase
MSDSRLEAKLLTYLREKRGEGFAERLKYRMKLHFCSLSLENRSVLEIGTGPGFVSAFCAAKGASRIIALEPEVAGSSSNVQKEFVSMSTLLGLTDLIDYRHQSFERFVENYEGEPFDYILMWNVINHLNEDATTRLHLRDAHSERKIFILHFRNMYKLLNAPGELIASDVARHNFWNAIGVKYFVPPSIQWHIHQQPKLWGELLGEAGFDSMQIKWCTPYTLRKFAPLLSWNFPTYLMNSSFIIKSHKSK